MTGTRNDDTPRWYGRRHGRKLRPGRQALIDELLPRLRLAPTAAGSLDLRGAFSDSVTDIWLEVGFGAGEHLAAQARNHPDIGFIGCEPFVNGVASLLSRVKKDGLTNVRIFDDDARKLFPLLPDAVIGRVYTLFSDPWPKKRHHRRRFVAAGTLDALARFLKDGAEFWFASDHKGYVSWTLENLIRHPDFSWPAKSKRDWTDPPPDWVETRYEKKARNQGLRPVYLCFRRRSRARKEGGKITENN